MTVKRKKQTQRSRNETLAQLAWLLRPDLQKAYPEAEDDPSCLQTWWRQSGRLEYPVWFVSDLKNRFGDKLLSPLSNWPCHGPFGVSPFLIHVLQQRTELKNQFDLSTEEGLWEAVAWVFSRGVVEYQIENVCGIDPFVRENLDRPYPLFKRQTSGSILTWLMFFLWRTESILQQNFDLNNEEDRTRYIAWFLLEGIDEYQLQEWVGDNTRNIIRQYYQASPPSKKNAIWQKPAPAVKKLNAKPEFGVNVIGFAFGELGIGEDARMAVAACEAAGLPCKVINIAPDSNVRQRDKTLLDYISAAAPDYPTYSVNLFCLTGFETARIFLEKGPPLFEERYNIGWWPWELPVWPKLWYGALEIVDEIWAATRFTEKMYAAAVRRTENKVPVTFMPMAVSIDKLNPKQNIRYTRRKHGLPQDAFLYLYVFDFNSYIERKNPIAVVQAFKQAFKSSHSNVGLVLKTMNARLRDPQFKAFMRHCTDKRIYIICDVMDRADVLGLMNACNAYVSLHRSEGFGRTLAEAMLMNKPVIATDYSGNTDFVNDKIAYPVKWRKKYLKNNDYPFIRLDDNAWWADVCIDHSASQIKEVFTDQNYIKTSQIINKKYGVETIGEKIKETIQNCLRRG